MKNQSEFFMQNKQISFRVTKGDSGIAGREFHLYYEIYYLLEGNVEFVTETTRTFLEKNSLVLIPKDTFHRFIVHSDVSDYERIVIQFYDIEILNTLIFGLFNKPIILYPLSDNLIRELLKIKCRSFYSYSEYKKSLFLQAVLTNILLEIDSLSPAKEETKNHSPVVQFCIQYINSNIHKKILLQDIANASGYSVSNISHQFKKELRLPIYSYILEKKLVLANIDIQNGAPTIRVAEKYGFEDYSNFYRRYKKRFGFFPSDRKSTEDISLFIKNK